MDTLETHFKGLMASDFIIDWNGYEVFCCDKPVGKIIEWNPVTRTLTYKKYGWLKRTWRRICKWILRKLLLRCARRRGRYRD